MLQIQSKYGDESDEKVLVASRRQLVTVPNNSAVVPFIHRAAPCCFGDPTLSLLRQ